MKATLKRMGPFDSGAAAGGAASAGGWLRWLVVVYAAVWGVLAISPLDRRDWLLENLLVFLSVPVLVRIHRSGYLTSRSWVCLFVFYLLHAVGAHYTYSEMPLGNWLRDLWGWQRNHYDRVVHFSFGLLLAVPMAELLTGLGIRGRYLPSIVALHALMGWSGLYEVMEGWVAILVSPELGAAFNGIQGDVWDSQKDMSLACLGACLSLTLNFFRSPRRGASA